MGNQVLCDLHEGPPQRDRIATLARSAVRMEAWAGMDQPTVETFMTALAEERDPAAEMLPADAALTGFVVGGWLLSASAPENASWEAVLDDALDTIFTVP